MSNKARLPLALCFICALIPCAFLEPSAASTNGFDDPGELTVYSQSLSSGATLDWGGDFGMGAPAGGGVRFQANSTSKRQGVMHRDAGVANANLVPVWETSVVFNLKDLDEGSDQKGELVFGLVNGNAVPSDQRKFFEEGNQGFSLRVRFDHKPTGTIRRVRTELRNRTGSNQNFGSVEGSLGEADFNGWLRATLTIVRQGPGDEFALSYTLESLGEDGDSAPVELRSEGPFTATNASFAGAAGLTQGIAFEVEKLDGNLGLALDEHRVSGAPSAPDAPGALSATLVGETVFTANWTLASGAHADSYLVEMSTAADDFAPGTFVAADGTPGQNTGVTVSHPAGSLAFSGLSGETAYRYRVRALNAVGDSPDSNFVDVVTLAGNAPPTLDPLGPVPTLHPAAGSFVVPLTGISPGPETYQTVTVTATSDNPAVLPDPVVGYSSPDSTGTLTLSPTGTEGSAIVTVTVDDGQAENHTVQRSFSVTVAEPPVNVAFDSASDLDLFASVNLNSAVAFGEDIGVAGGGGFAVTNTSPGNDTAWLAWREQAYPTAGASYFETSFAFNLREWAEAGPGERIRGDFFLGFLLDPSVFNPSKPWEVFEKGSASRGLSVRLKAEHRPGDKDRELEVEFFNKASSSDASKSGKQTLGAMPFENWMQIRLVLVPQSATTLAATWILEDLGPDGDAAPETIAMAGPTPFTNAALMGGPYAFASLAVNPHKDNPAAVATYIDEHAAEVQTGPPPAPEPLPATLVTGSAFTANWAAPAAYVTSYTLEVSAAADHFAPGSFLSETGATGQPTGILIPDPATASLRLSGLLPDTEYVYRLLSTGPQGSSEPGAEESLTTLPPGVNAAPTLNPIPAPPPLAPGSPAFPVALSGITDGGEGGQTLSLSAVSDNPALVSQLEVVYESPDEIGLLLVTPDAELTGTATITVTVDDGAANHRTTQRHFTLTVREFPVLVPFDSADEIDEFETSASNLDLQWQADAGLGDPPGGALALSGVTHDQNRALVAWRGQPLALAGAGVAETSLLINLREIDAITSGEGKAELRIGFTDGTETNPAKPHEFMHKKTNSNRAISVLLKAEHKPGDKDRRVELELANKNTDNDAGSAAKQTLEGAPFGNWMRLVLRLEARGAGAFAASYRLDDLGADGLGIPATVLETSSPVLFANAGLASSVRARAALVVRPDKKLAQTLYLDEHRAFASAEADLLELLTGEGTLNPAFDRTVGSYSLEVASSSLVVTATPANPAAGLDFRVNGSAFAALPSAAASSPIPLAVGPNTLELRVTAPGGEGQRSYFVSVFADYVPEIQLDAGGFGGLSERSLAGGALDSFRFALSSARRLDLSGLGALDGILRDAEGNALATFTGALSGQPLRAGVYFLEVLNLGSGTETYSLALDASTLAVALPSLAPARPTLTSRKASPVNGSVSVANEGNLPEALLVRGGRGNRLFRATYRQGGNVTAAVVRGRFNTGVLAATDGPRRIGLRVVPNRRSLVKDGRVQRRQTQLAFEATAESVPAPTATARVRVRTR